MRHFKNLELDAPNVLRVKVDASVVGELRALFNTPLKASDYSVVSPHWASDIRWISARSLDTYRMFLSIFKRLKVAEHVAPFLDLDKQVILYSGFIVTRSVCEKPNFHLDWIDTNNEAFTLLTPISSNAAGFGLLYERTDGTIAEYEYRDGEALIFGDHFRHSTRPGRSDSQVALLSFTFGTDKMEHWEKIRRTALTQGSLIRLPDGHFLAKDVD